MAALHGSATYSNHCVFMQMMDYGDAIKIIVHSCKNQNYGGATKVTIIYSYTLMQSPVYIW